MLSYTIIYNPASGHAKGPTAAEQLKAKLEDRQRQVSMAPTKSADAPEILLIKPNRILLLQLAEMARLTKSLPGSHRANNRQHSLFYRKARSTTWLKSCIFRCCCHWRSRTF